MSGMLHFRGISFDPRSGEIVRPDATVKLRPQAAAALEFLIRRRGNVVPKEQLSGALWPDSRVVLYDASIATVIRELRVALEDDSRAPKFIETIPRRGYRFVAPVRDEKTVGTTWRFFDPRRAVSRGLRVVAISGLVSAMLALSGTEPVPLMQSKPAYSGSLVVSRVQPLDDSEPAHAIARVLTAELATFLSSVAPRDLRIIQQASQDREVPMPEPNAWVLQTEVRSDQQTIVLTSRLVSTVDQSAVKSFHFRRKADDLDLAARELAARISQIVVNRTLHGEDDAPSKSPLEPEVLSMYAEGRRLLDIQSHDAVENAIECFERVIDAAPEFPDARVSLAEALLAWPGPQKTESVIKRAKNAARQAITLGASDGRAQLTLAKIAMFYDRRWHEAEQYIRRAVKLAPAEPKIRQLHAAWLTARGRHTEALREIELARALDPPSVAINIDVMLFHYFARDFDATIRAARRLSTLWPGNYGSARHMILAHEAMGDIASAAKHARSELVRLNVVPSDQDWAQVDDEEILDAYWRSSSRALERVSADSFVDPAARAVFHVQAGDTGRALELLEQARSERYFSFQVPFLGVTPALDDLRGHPVFERILRELDQAAVSDFYQSPRVADHTP